MSEKASILEDKLNEMIEENSSLKAEILESNRLHIIANLSEGLALSEKEKFSDLLEGIEFTGDLEAYEIKASAIKNTFFKESSKPHSSNITEETFEEPQKVNASYKNTDPEMSRFVQAISKTLKTY